MLSPELKRKVLAATRGEPSPTRPQLMARTIALAASGVLVPLVIFLAWGGTRLGPRPTLLVAATAGGAFLIAALAFWIALERGPSMLGRARGWLIAAAVGAPLAFLAWKVSFSAGVPGMMDAWPTRAGYRCLGLTTLIAAWPFAVLALLRRGSDPTHPRSLGAALGVAAAAAAVALTDLWCPVGHVRHLVLGHVLPMAMLGILGIVVGQRVLAVRARRR
jgi:hypothetical protein